MVAWVDLHRVDIGWLTRVFILWGSDVGPNLGAGKTPVGSWEDV